MPKTWAAPDQLGLRIACLATTIGYATARCAHIE